MQPPVDPSLAKRGYSRILLRYPQLSESLKHRQNQSGELRHLLDAYEQACDALDGWRRAPPDGTDARLVEYETMVAELETDIVRACKKQ